jgi:hypothetical protein
MERERLQPKDWTINWIGPPGTTDYDPCADPIVPGNRKLRLKLAVAKEDWDRLWDETIEGMRLSPAKKPTPPAAPEAVTNVDEQDGVVALKPIPNVMLYGKLEEIKREGGPIPSQDKTLSRIKSECPGYAVPRTRARKAHNEVLGKQPAGKRRRLI